MFVLALVGLLVCISTSLNSQQRQDTCLLAHGHLPSIAGQFRVSNVSCITSYTHALTCSLVLQEEQDVAHFSVEDRLVTAAALPFADSMMWGEESLPLVSRRLFRGNWHDRAIWLNITRNNLVLSDDAWNLQMHEDLPQLLLPPATPAILGKSAVSWSLAGNIGSVR